MLTAFIAIGGIGLVAGLGLAVASKLFYVYVDPKIIAVEEALPGANCGGCGYPGCSGAASAIVRGVAPPNICVGGGSDVHVKVAAILGVQVAEREPEIARPGCTYGLQDADLKYVYDGVNDCRAAILLDGGSKVCPIGCIGLGTCVRACPFGALSMGEDNLPVVNPALCTGCGTCERICPKNIITLTSNSRRIQDEYTTDQCSAPCARACPAGIRIPEYIRRIAQGDPLDAVKVIKETNPFPAVCGRVCVHPCELQCRRNLVDQPVAINPLKRFATDKEMASGQRVQIPRAPASGKRMAVVGGGVEGLTAGYFLNRIGHDAVVYEASSELGGVLRVGIPENRLPRNVLDWDIQGILEAGVEAVTGSALGRDFSIPGLLESGFSAVFVATGGGDNRLILQGGGDMAAPLPGVQRLVDFILRARAGNNPSAGKRVVILGGGDAGIEAARACLNAGAKGAYIVSRTSVERLSDLRKHLNRSEREWIDFHPQSAVIRMMGRGDRLTHVEIASIHAGTGEAAERAVIEADTLLVGAGRFPELIYVSRANEEKKDGERGGDEVLWETLYPYAGPSAEQTVGIFRPGEVSSDYTAVVEAIGSGRRAANTMHRFFTGQMLDGPEHMIRTGTEVLSLEELEPVSQAPRQKMAERPMEERIADPALEIVLGFTDEQAVEEAKRCLQCGLICYRRIQGSLQ